MGVAGRFAGASSGSLGFELDWAVYCAVAATALLITDFYPLTQVYQIAEDAGRGNPLLADRLHQLNPRWQEVLAVAALRFGCGRTVRDGVS